MREEQTIAPDAEPCCCSWTGGKDCNLALAHAWRDPSLHVCLLVVFRPEHKADFDAHPRPIMEAQAEAIGLPLRVIVLPASEPYRDAYISAIRALRDDQGIRVICTGDMDLVGTMGGNWIKECSEAAGGVRAYLPLWKADRASCLDALMKENFSVVFTCVKQPWFDESWCGRRLDRDAIEVMTEMSKGCLHSDVEMENWSAKDPRRKPLDLGGENGEYHSMVLGGPQYASDINIDMGKDIKVKSKEFVSETAKNGEERWWTYDGQKWWTLGEFKVETQGNLGVEHIPTLSTHKPNN